MDTHVLDPQNKQLLELFELIHLNLGEIQLNQLLVIKITIQYFYFQIFFLTEDELHLQLEYLINDHFSNRVVEYGFQIRRLIGVGRVGFHGFGYKIRIDQFPARRTRIVPAFLPARNTGIVKLMPTSQAVSRTRKRPPTDGNQLINALR